MYVCLLKHMGFSIFYTRKDSLHREQQKQFEATEAITNLIVQFEFLSSLKLIADGLLVITRVDEETVEDHLGL